MDAVLLLDKNLLQWQWLEVRLQKEVEETQVKLERVDSSSCGFKYLQVLEEAFSFVLTHSYSEGYLSLRQAMEELLLTGKKGQRQGASQVLSYLQRLA